MPPRLLLALILVAGLALRLWNIDYGLPYVWNLDEQDHFTNRAVDMFREGYDPGYYQNPAAYTYLVHLVLRLMYGPLGFLFELPFGNVTDQFKLDPTAIFTAARVLAAALCVAGALAAYAAARRLWGVREGLVAAAVMSFAFLPVAYSRVAVTDVGALPGVALALWAAVRVHEDGRARWYLFAGAAGGLALAFKYTAGLALLPLLIAALGRAWRERAPQPLVWLAAGSGCAALAFLALNPFLVWSLDDWWGALRGQADVAADQPKPGQESGGASYYLDSLTWGLGWAALVAAVGGAALEARRDLMRAVLLLALPVALFAYLSIQSRYFGRWLLPAYPALAMLASVALVRVAHRIPARSRLRALALAGLTALVLAQPLAADVRSALVLGRDDTREQARDFLVRAFPPELRASVEPAVPARWYRSAPDGRDPSWLRRCERRPGWKEPGWSYPGPAGTRVCARNKPGQVSRQSGGVRASAYHLVLDPNVIDDYRFYGYCVIVTFGVVRDRALETGDPDVRAYYRRLDGESRVLRRYSPYDRGSDGVPFSFDLSYNYYPPEYHRPGPVSTIHRLDRCRQAYGAPIIQIPRAREIPPGAAPDALG